MPNDATGRMDSNRLADDGYTNTTGDTQARDLSQSPAAPAKDKG
jgi:hypothetical protein